MIFIAADIPRYIGQGIGMYFGIPYRWLISFYGEAGFREVRREDVPPFLAQRHAKYVHDGLDVVLMARHCS